MTRTAWARWEIVAVQVLYPHWPTARIATLIGRTVSGVYQTAAKLGCEKTPAYLASPEACRLRRGCGRGVEFQFKRGQVPHNKGLRRPGWSPGRMRETQFKAGQRGSTYMPIGTERVSAKDGYLERKVTDDKRTPRDWRAVHLLIWEEHHGPVPPGHAVCFKDGDKGNVVIQNLELISRAELMRRNSSQRWGPKVFQLIQLRGALNRKIRSRSEKQNV